jgi:hypothetical protein
LIREHPPAFHYAVREREVASTKPGFCPKWKGEKWNLEKSLKI